MDKQKYWYYVPTLCIVPKYWNTEILYQDEIFESINQTYVQIYHIFLFFFSTAIVESCFVFLFFCSLTVPWYWPYITSFQVTLPLLVETFLMARLVVSSNGLVASHNLQPNTRNNTVFSLGKQTQRQVYSNCNYEQSLILAFNAHVVVVFEYWGSSQKWASFN